MHLNIVRQDSAACTNGTGSFYVCGNGFRGCCTVDACSLSTCPDKVSSSSVSVVTTIILSAQPASSPTDTISTTAAVLTTHSTTTGSTVLTSTSPSPLSSTSVAVSSSGNGLVAAVPATSASPSATSTNLADSTSTSSPNHTGLIVGLVCGIVVLSILSILAWFCIRRQQRKRGQNTRKSYGRPSSPKELVLERSNTGETEALRKSQGDVFAAFGGRYKSPQREPAELAHPEIQDPSTEQNEDTPLPDIEKARVKTPPVHEHPAYATNSSKYQPSMTSHPAYHVSQLSTHPAFRSVHVSHVSPSRSNQSIRATYQIASPRPGQMDEIVSEAVSPLASSPLISSPIAGHSELEAEVPASYVSPVALNIPYQYPAAQQSTGSREGRERTEIFPSSAGIPIGLGVRSTPNSTPSSSPAPNLPPPSANVRVSNPRPKNSNTALRPQQISSIPSTFIPSGGEIVSQIQRPTPRLSNNSLQNAPIVSHLQSTHQQHSSWSTPTYRYSLSEEKEMGLSVPEGSHPSQRWSDVTIVPPLSIPRKQNSLSVPDLIAAANLGVSPDPSVAGRNSESGGEDRTPTSPYTDVTATWGSWAAR